MNIAKQAHESHDEFHLIDTPKELTEFAINSFVLLQPANRAKSKLETQWSGPYKVVNFSKGKYTIQDLVTFKTHDVHVSRLKPFLYDQLTVDPVQVARSEQQDAVVDRDLPHRNEKNSNYRTDMEFYIKWAGWDDSYNSWIPWENARNNIELLKYLYLNKMRYLLTKEQKAEVAQILQQV